MNSIQYRIAQLEDKESIFQFEIKRRFGDKSDDIENQMLVWSSAYRLEALEHYLKLGWSFLALNSKNEIQGFFLGQPLLFFDQQTQTLWLEYLSAVDSNIQAELLQIAYKLSREKHFQRVLFGPEVESIAREQGLPVQQWSRQNFLLKTTK